MSEGLLLGGCKLRQHYSSYLIASVNLNQLIIMKTLIIANFFPKNVLYNYIFSL